MDGGGGKQDGPKKSENKAPQCSKHIESMKKIDFEQIWKNHFLVIFVVDTGIFFVVDTGGGCGPFWTYDWQINQPNANVPFF